MRLRFEFKKAPQDVQNEDGDLEVEGRYVRQEVFRYLNDLRLLGHVLTHTFDSDQERMKDYKGRELKRSRIVNLDLKIQERNKDLVLQSLSRHPLYLCGIYAKEAQVARCTHTLLSDEETPSNEDSYESEDDDRPPPSRPDPARGSGSGVEAQRQ